MRLKVEVEMKENDIGHMVNDHYVPDRGAGTCAQDRRALQQFVLNVHVKLSYLT